MESLYHPWAQKKKNAKGLRSYSLCIGPQRNVSCDLDAFKHVRSFPLYQLRFHFCVSSVLRIGFIEIYSLYETCITIIGLGLSNEESVPPPHTHTHSLHAALLFKTPSHACLHVHITRLGNINGFVKQNTDTLHKMKFCGLLSMDISMEFRLSISCLLVGEVSGTSRQEVRSIRCNRFSPVTVFFFFFFFFLQFMS